MKKILLPALSLLLCASALVAQDLSVPNNTPAPAENPTPVVEPKHNDASDSFRRERIAIRKGNSLFNKKDYHKAIEEYDKALAINGGSLAGRYNKARALLELNNDQTKGTEKDPRMQAVRLFQEIIPQARQLQPEIAEFAYYNLGNIALADEQLDQAIAAYKSALRMNPADSDARYNLRIAQLKKQQQEQDKQDQNKDKDKDKQDQQQQQEQQDQQQDQQQQQQEQPQPQPSQSSQQILQTMQNKENSTRKKAQEKEARAGGRPQTDKPW